MLFSGLNSLSGVSPDFKIKNITQRTYLDELEKFVTRNFRDEQDLSIVPFRGQYKIGGLVKFKVIDIKNLSINEILYGAKTIPAKLEKEAAAIGTIVHDTICDFHAAELARKKRRYTAAECAKYLTRKSKEQIAEFIKKVPTVQIPPEFVNRVNLALSFFVNWRERIYYEIHFEIPETAVAGYGYAGSLDVISAKKRRTP